MEMYHKDGPKLTDDQLKILNHARTTYFCCMAVQAHAKSMEVSARNLVIVTAYRWFTSVSGTSLASLPEVVRKKITPLVE